MFLTIKRLTFLPAFPMALNMLTQESFIMMTKEIRSFFPLKKLVKF